MEKKKFLLPEMEVYPYRMAEIFTSQGPGPGEGEMERQEQTEQSVSGQMENTLDFSDLLPGIVP